MFEISFLSVFLFIHIEFLKAFLLFLFKPDHFFFVYLVIESIQLCVRYFLYISNTNDSHLKNTPISEHLSLLVYESVIL